MTIFNRESLEVVSGAAVTTGVGVGVDVGTTAGTAVDTAEAEASGEESEAVAAVPFFSAALRMRWAPPDSVKTSSPATIRPHSTITVYSFA